jgi:hypothetical protein
MHADTEWAAMHEPPPWRISERIGHDDMLSGGGAGGVLRVRRNWEILIGCRFRPHQ